MTVAMALAGWQQENQHVGSMAHHTGAQHRHSMRPAASPRSLAHHPKHQGDRSCIKLPLFSE